MLVKVNADFKHKFMHMLNLFLGISIYLYFGKGSTYLKKTVLDLIRNTLVSLIEYSFAHYHFVKKKKT